MCFVLGIMSRRAAKKSGVKMGKKKGVAVHAESGFYEQVRDVFVAARQFVHKTANFAMVKAYWLVGKNDC